MGALRTTNTYLAAQYTRLRPRLWHAQALVAVEHSILVSTFYMLQRNQPYHDLGADYFIRAKTPRDEHANSSANSKRSATPSRLNHHRPPPHSSSKTPRGPVVFSSDPNGPPDRVIGD